MRARALPQTFRRNRTELEKIARAYREAGIVDATVAFPRWTILAWAVLFTLLSLRRRR